MHLIKQLLNYVMASRLGETCGDLSKHTITPIALLSNQV